MSNSTRRQQNECDSTGMIVAFLEDGLALRLPKENVFERNDFLFSMQYLTSEDIEVNTPIPQYLDKTTP